MNKGQQTRQAIVVQAAQVFVTRGFFGTSINDLMRSTGLTKGGIYNHFESKEALALEAFDYAFGLLRQRFRQILGDEHQSVGRLFAVLHLFQSLIEDPLFLGGCPLLSTAVEADDTNPALRDRARQAMTQWQKFITHTVELGIETGEVTPNTDPDSVATTIIATLEGAIMLSKLYDDNAHMHHAVSHLRSYLSSFIQTTGKEEE